MGFFSRGKFFCMPKKNDSTVSSMYYVLCHMIFVLMIMHTLWEIYM